MNILVAEDDHALSLFLSKALELDGHHVRCVADGQTALELAEHDGLDLLVLDLGLPQMDGVDVLKRLRERACGVSVMVLSGRSHLQQRLECLDLGADDYLIKPFSLHELRARCRGMARRRVGSNAGMLGWDGLRMDRIARSVTFDGQDIDFTSKEFVLMEYLLLHRSRSVTRRELLDKVWHMPADAGTNVVDVYVNYLRRKLSLAGSTDMIETVRGEGYAIGMTRKPLHLNRMPVRGVVMGPLYVPALETA